MKSLNKSVNTKLFLCDLLAITKIESNLELLKKTKAKEEGCSISCEKTDKCIAFIKKKTLCFLYGEKIVQNEKDDLLTEFDLDSFFTEFKEKPKEEVKVSKIEHKELTVEAKNNFEVDLDDMFGYKVVNQKNDNILSQDLNNELAQKPLEEYLPTGDYNRLFSDTFYSENFKFFYRFRSLREIFDYENSIISHFKTKEKEIELKDQKPQFFKLRASKGNDLSSLRLQPKLIKIGRSGDKKVGKDIEAIEFGNPLRKRHIFIISSLRGCEWVTPMATIHSIITLLGRDTTQELLQAVRFHVIPIANPMGYEYSRKSAKGQNWCKNRRLIQSTQSHGVDLSKNFGLPPLLQQHIKSSLLKKSKKKKKVVDYTQIYNFSETETEAIRTYIDKYNTGIGSVALLNLRCCSGQITAPSLYEDRKVDVHVDTIASLFSNLIAREGAKYTKLERDDEFNKKFTGNIIDWAHSERNINHVYEVNLKASGLTTRTNHDLISEEPFVLLTRQLERALVFIAQLLLSQPLENN